MIQQSSLDEPKLAAPGAGLPFLEWAVAKFILFPRLFRTTPKSTAIELFSIESEKILGLAKELSPSQLSKRCLVPRLPGLEDSSRFWSVAMAMEHLIIVGDRMRKIVVDLSAGGTSLPNTSVAEVKPSREVDAGTIVQRFQRMTDDFIADTTAADVHAFTEAKYAHPWFGPLNAHQWLIFAAPHQRIHRKQIEEILKRSAPY